ncbi:TetR family transcriptional regulator [Nocardioides sp. J9]|uniref:TetR/AcrR family transcriptional regulator n=1 Tax=unclassified Nocardioides TaxID=2615069 RepID=UPI0004B05F46|nr:MULTISPECIES: TetR family transcriptional regulator [unclassified Nocardioides]TWG90639.1 TetR family transcriptional regulator [Nocardioides sp. J9]
MRVPLPPRPSRPQRARRRSAQERSAAVFAALRNLLIEQPWGDVTLEAVARDAGVSRQTLYNTFGSRYGLARAYTLALADALCDVIAEAVAEHPGDPRAGLEHGLLVYLQSAADDPLIGRVREGDAHPDLVRIVTADAAPLLVLVTGRLEEMARAAWPDVDDARAFARTTARLAASYVTMPPEDDADPADLAAELADVLAPR